MQVAVRNGWALRSFQHPRRWLSMTSTVCRSSAVSETTPRVPHRGIQTNSLAQAAAINGAESETAAPGVLRGARPELKKLRVGGVPEHFNAPWHTAAAAGRFEAAGLELEWTDFHGGTGAMTSALRDGSIDVAVVLTEGIVADLHSTEKNDFRGCPAKLLGTYVSTPLTWGVHVHHSSPLQSLSEVQDEVHKFAVSRMGSGSHLMACVQAQRRGRQPSALRFETVQSLEGARASLRDGTADLFMWEKFTTKHLVDAGEWRRIGEFPTPWPCFAIAATDDALASHGPELLAMLQITRSEAKRLAAAPDVTSVIGLMFGQKEVDVAEWLRGVEWSVEPTVSYNTLHEVMGGLVEAGVLNPAELLPPSALVSSLSTNADEQQSPSTRIPEEH